MADKVTLTAVGDIGFRIEENGDTFDGIRPFTEAADINFGQLEQLISGETGGVRHLHFDGFDGSDMNGSSQWMPTPEKGAQVIKDAHINVMSYATNHTMDIGDEALFETLDTLEAHGVHVIGAGRNLADARKPYIFDVKGTKVGFLGYCSVVTRGYAATATHAGCVPLRASTSIEVYDTQPGMPPRIHTKANPGEMAAMIEDIKSLKEQVDVVVVSMHWGIHWHPDVIADYQKELAHAAIDAGADLILGSHPHIMKGVEVYKGKVIFYSLSNFSMRRYEGFQFKPEKASDIYWVTRFGVRAETNPDCPRYPYDINSQKNILVKAEIEEGKISRVSYVPLWMNNDAVFMPVDPASVRSDEHLRYLRWMSGSQGFDVKFVKDGAEVVIDTDYVPFSEQE
ncbi:MAG: CapA family protein [Clostridiales bacterium]|nr:CapA family protein [Clostridiales bacterium]